MITIPPIPEKEVVWITGINDPVWILRDVKDYQDFELGGERMFMWRSIFTEYEQSAHKHARFYTCKEWEKAQTVNLAQNPRFLRMTDWKAQGFEDDVKGYTVHQMSVARGHVLLTFATEADAIKFRLMYI